MILAAILVTATVWLAASGRLGLYIHPRYFGFTVVMAIIGGIAVVAAFAMGAPAADHADEDHHDDGPRRRTRGGARRRRVSATASIVGSAVIVVVAAIALIAVPPTTLSASLADNRDVNGTITVSDPAASVALVGTDTSGFTVKDWAVLIRQGGSDSVLRSATPTIEGFVVPIDGDADAFTVARYAVTCCAVDAQPFGVTVIMPGWRAIVADGGWVSATGRFIENPDAGADTGWVLQATEVVAIDEPAEPYVF